MNSKNYKYILKLLIIFYISIFNIENIYGIEDLKKKETDSLIKVDNNFSTFQEDLYLLGSGDSLLFSVIGVPELKTNIRILNDGKAIIPLLGPVKLKGLSIKSASVYLESLLKKELINPKVELFILQNRPIKISIIGEVIRPGIYKLPSNTNDLPTVITAIEEAGGISKFADLTDIKLRRRLPGDDLKYKETSLNFKDLLFNGEHFQNPYLFDGDILAIQKVKKIDKEILRFNSTTLSPKTITVNFLGEISKPGTKELDSNTTLIDGILAAGGPRRWRSNYGYVEILRINRNGSAFRKRYKINLSQNYSERNNPVLNDGDSVWIRRNSFAKTTDTIGAIADPLKDFVSLWTLFKLVD